MAADKLTVGLTGGTGTGKSTVSMAFKECGFEIIDFDLISRQVCEAGSDCLKEICDNFGYGILNADKTLNRKALGEIVFSDSIRLALLNRITHKYITLRSEEILNKSTGSKFVFDAPLLFEAGLEEKCDCVVSVLSTIEKRAERIMLRDSISWEYALKRINSQKKNEFYIEKSDYIIYNNNSVEKLNGYVAAMIRDIEDAWKRQMIPGADAREFSTVKIYGKDVF